MTQFKAVEVIDPESTTQITPSITTLGVPTLKFIPVNVTVVPPYIVPVFGFILVTIGVEVAKYRTEEVNGNVCWPLSRVASVVKSVISGTVRSFRM